MGERAIKSINVRALTSEQEAAKELLYELWAQTGKDPNVEIRTFRTKYPDLPFGQVFEALLAEKIA